MMLQSQMFYYYGSYDINLKVSRLMAIIRPHISDQEDHELRAQLLIRA
jgi:hypothetical protein